MVVLVENLIKELLNTGFVKCEEPETAAEIIACCGVRTDVACYDGKFRIYILQ